jgi:hypothetical protein
MEDDTTRQSVLFSDLADKPVVAKFDQEHASSDGGAILRTPQSRSGELAGQLRRHRQRSIR